MEVDFSSNYLLALTCLGNMCFGGIEVVFYQHDNASFSPFTSVCDHCVAVDSQLLLCCDNMLVFGVHFCYYYDEWLIVKGSSSDSIPVTSGVPQGSVVGRPCFCCLSKTLVLTSAQTSDYIIHRAVGTHRDAERLQEDLNRLEEWATQIRWSSTHTNTNTSWSQEPEHQLYPNIPYMAPHWKMVENIKCTVISFAKDLPWKAQCGNVRNACCATFRFLQRDLWVMSVAIKTLAYTTFIWPVCPVWSPHTEHDTHQIEIIQLTAARWVLAWHGYRDNVTEMFNC